MLGVSVVLPTYNAEDTVAEAVESVLNQTYGVWELIVVDCSTDGTVRVVQSFKDPRIRVYHYGRRLPIGRARRIAVERSTPRYRYVAYIDADDLWYPDHLEVGVRYLNRHPLVGFIYTAMRDEVNGVYIAELDRPEFGQGIRSRRSLRNPREPVLGNEAKRRARNMEDVGIPPPITWIHRKVIFRRAGNWHPYRPLWEDGEFLYRVAQTFWRFAYVDRVTAWYRPRPESLSQKYLKFIREFPGV
jgi:glycosyltransferase involved in cell wall biosynthesis